MRMFVLTVRRQSHDCNYGPCRPYDDNTNHRSVRNAYRRGDDKFRRRDHDSKINPEMGFVCSRSLSSKDGGAKIGDAAKRSHSKLDHWLILGF